HPHGETLSVARTRALVASAARIARPTPLAPGMRDCARIESRWRSVSESPSAADLAALPPEQAARSARVMVSERARIGPPMCADVICRGAACRAPTFPEARFVNRLSVLSVLVVGACARPSLTDQLARASWVDLTYAFDSTTIYWPTAKPFRLEVVSAQRTPAGYYYAANNFAAVEHGATHLDAPVHFAEGKLSADQIPVTRLTGPAVVIDVSGQAAADRDVRVAPADHEAWERDHTPIPEGMVVL